jgi:hypothetical protein
VKRELENTDFLIQDKHPTAFIGYLYKVAGPFALAYLLSGCIAIDKSDTTIELEKRCAIGGKYTEKADGVTISRITRIAPATIFGSTIDFLNNRLTVSGPNMEKTATDQDGNIYILETGKRWSGYNITLITPGEEGGKLDLIRRCDRPWLPPPRPNKNDSGGFHPGRESKPTPQAFKGY